MENVLSVVEKADPFQTWWPVIIAIAIGLIVTLRTIMGGQRCPNDNQIRDQVVIITGGNSGIGLEIAKDLLARGGRIILACRNISAAEKAISILRRELKSRSLNPMEIDQLSIEVRYLDLRSFDAVHRFARQITQHFHCVDVLINNAGIIFDAKATTIQGGTTVDGFETHLQVNYLAHCLHTKLLEPLLRRSEQGRIINVSAHAHAAARMDIDDPLNVSTWAVKFHARDSFAHSKLAVILWTRWLAKELKDTSKVTVNCCTPGLVRGTNHLRSSPLMSAFTVRLITFPWMWLFMKNPFEGSQTAIHLATDPKLSNVTGEYFNDCMPAKSSILGQDLELAKRLYQQTIRELQKKTKLEIQMTPIPPNEDEG